ncbi:MAG: methionine--tRNA ligase [bacterium]|nr:methionine--tRNA ligase [bacterium]
MKFYLTAAIPYVNAKPHMGHALEFVQGDVLARWHRQKGDDTFYVSGADENSLKIVQAAEKESITPKQLADKYAEAFQNLLKSFNISLDKFQRSGSEENAKSAQELWEKCSASGDIYKKSYRGLYCVGCEAFYTRDELNAKGECLNHPGKPVDEVEEENYFFRLTKYKDQLKKIIESDEYAIISEKRKHEALGMFTDKFEDFSISRSIKRARGWGVPVPGDESQIMYVWFDALNVYRSAVADGLAGRSLGEGWWPADLHIIGKDLIRFHAIYWPAILLSAKLPLPKKLFVHGFITINGQKMSKSIGNVIDPMELVSKYGVEPVRYYLLREIPTDDDGDFTEEKFRLRFNADLANGLGNFASRVLTLAQKFGPLTFDFEQKIEIETTTAIKNANAGVEQSVASLRLHDALAAIWKLISYGDGYVNTKKPWELEAGSSEQGVALVSLLYVLHTISNLLIPFLPETAAKIQKCIIVDKKKKQYLCSKPETSLFPRLNLK